VSGLTAIEEPDEVEFRIEAGGPGGIKSSAFVVLVAASVIVAVGECFHTSALSPLVASLAPPGLRGRYMAAIGVSWWIGLALAPTVGLPMLSISPITALLAAAGLAGVASVSAIALDAVLPEASRRTPRPIP
jgi:hypothetical protein